jgi:sugar phosphate isomerase/epimerase
MDICLYPGLKRVVRTGRASVACVSLFCPRPIDPGHLGTDSCHLTSRDRARRDAALAWSRLTLDYAAEIGAPFVVVPLGRTEAPPFTAGLCRLVAANRLHGREFVARKLRAVRAREQESTSWMPRARAALETLLPLAASRGLRLALAPAADWEEGPTEGEMLALLREFGSGPLGYWHDFGRIQRRANLGFLDHAQWLESVRPHLVGCHLDDVRWPDLTGAVPLSGMIDFDRLVPLLPRGVPLVWNPEATSRPTDLKQSLASWEERFGTPRPA